MGSLSLCAPCCVSIFDTIWLGDKTVYYYYYYSLNQQKNKKTHSCNPRRFEFGVNPPPPAVCVSEYVFAHARGQLLEVSSFHYWICILNSVLRLTLQTYSHGEHSMYLIYKSLNNENFIIFYNFVHSNF